MKRFVRIPFTVKVEVVVILISSFWIPNINAFSTGAGSCVGGQAAVSGLHLENSPSRITFAEAGLGFFINDYLIDESNTANNNEAFQTIRVGGLYDFVLGLVKDDDGSYEPFKGALIRISQGDETSMANFISESAFSTKPFNSQISDQCDGVDALGVTHFNDSLKTSLGGQFDTSSFNEISIDITVVFSNNETAGSKFAYQSYVIGVVPMETTPTEIPQQPDDNENNICWLCGEEGMRVGNGSGVFDLSGTLYNCLDMEQNATQQLEASSTVCQNIQAALAEDPDQTCNCIMMLSNETMTPTSNSTSATTIEPNTAQPSSTITTTTATPSTMMVPALRPSPSPSMSPMAASGSLPSRGVSSAAMALTIISLWMTLGSSLS